MVRPGSLEEGALFADDYRILRPLQAGGMGAVYVVEQLSTGSQRALKVMLPELVDSEGQRRRFAQEARVGSQIKSDHVVQVLAAGVDEPTGMPWLVMELLEGEDLSAYVARRGALEPAEVGEMLNQACHALAEAHRAGIVHRDLKPENLFLSVPLRDGIPFTLKVLDFGIAKVVADAQTHATGPVGTPTFMAPEQTATGEKISPAADVWALGLIAFRLLTGKSYWRGANVDNPTPMALLREVVIDDLPSAGERARELDVADRLPPGFDPWFARCVVRDAEDRFPDAAAVRGALPSALGLEPVGSVPLGSVSDQANAVRADSGAFEATIAVGDEISSAPTEAGGLTTGRGVVSPAQEDVEVERLHKTLSSSPSAGRWWGLLALVVVAGGVVALVMSGEEPSASAEASGAVPAGKKTCPPRMAAIAAGAYQLGDSKRSVTVAPFCMDITEVTAADYDRCVDGGKCTAEGLACHKAATHAKPGKEAHPINCVTWEQALTYCTTHGKRLPSEEEWEWVARGGAKAQNYPWGNQPPGAQLCWSGGLMRFETCEVDRFKLGDSPDRVSDLAGNVVEWTSSRFESTGSSRVYKGGSWAEKKQLAVGAAARFRAAPTERGELLGFRCVAEGE